MGDFAVRSQDYNRVTIWSFSPESLGLEFRNLGLNAAGATWPSANRAIFVPFVVPSPFLVARLFIANGATAAGNVDVGIYDTGGNRVVSAGSTAQAGTSALQFFDVTDFTLAPGVYFLAAAMDGTTATANAVTPGSETAAAVGVVSQSSAFPLPANATFAAAQDAYIPMVGVTGRTI